MANSVSTAKIVRKRTKKFHRHQADRFMRVDASWRKPIGEFIFFADVVWQIFIGIDSRVRRRFKGQYLMPSIGYGTKASDRHRCSVRRALTLWFLFIPEQDDVTITSGPKELQKICCQQCCWIGSPYDEQPRLLRWNRPRSFCQEEKSNCWTCWTTRYPRHQQER